MWCLAMTFPGKRGRECIEQLHSCSVAIQIKASLLFMSDIHDMDIYITHCMYVNSYKLLSVLCKIAFAYWGGWINEIEGTLQVIA